MARSPQILWVLFKAAIFSVLAPFMVGLVLPRYVHWAFVPIDYRLHTPLWSDLTSPAFLVIGAIIYLWCAWDFAAKGMGTPAPIDAPKRLVVNGLYRFVRNPMYLGVCCLIFSQALLFYSKWILLYLAFVACCFHFFIILYEELHLQKSFCEQYTEYCRNVSRWIPRFRPYRLPPT